MQSDDLGGKAYRLIREYSRTDWSLPYLDFPRQLDRPDYFVPLLSSQWLFHTSRAQASTSQHRHSPSKCRDTLGYFFRQPDMSRYLGGSDVGFEIPGPGVFVGPNLTPDKETGLGNWTKEPIVAALKTAKRPDKRELAPIMPGRAFANLTEEDVSAIAAFSEKLAARSSQSPGPLRSK